MMVEENAAVKFSCGIRNVLGFSIPSIAMMSLPEGFLIVLPKSHILCLSKVPGFMFWNEASLFAIKVAVIGRLQWNSLFRWSLEVVVPEAFGFWLWWGVANRAGQAYRTPFPSL